MIIKYIPLLVLLFFSLKLLISYVEKSTNSLKNKVEDSKIENGMHFPQPDKIEKIVEDRKINNSIK